LLARQHGRLHLNADWVILESVDARGRPVPPGRPGARSWLTSLANHVQPVIRHELGDRVCFAGKPCACGSSLPVIDVEGRSDDLLAFTDGRGQRVRLAPLALTTLLEEGAGVYRFVLRQRNAAALTLELYAPAPGAAARAATLMRDHLRAQGLQAVRLTVRCLDQPPPVAASGKRQRVVGLSRRSAPR
jgi:phenylacetate-CoA ligase